MFAPKAAQAHIETADSSRGKLPQASPHLLERQVARSAAHPEHLQSGPSWSFANLPIFPPGHGDRRQERLPLTVAPFPGVLQRKLRIGVVDDPLEHEADRVAEQVMRMPHPATQINHEPSDTPANIQTQPSTASGHGALVQRKCSCGWTCDACEAQQSDEIAGKVQRKPAAPQISRVVSSPVTAGMEAPPVVHEVLRSPGQPLDTATRAFFEPRFGHDFSRVRVHSGGRAAESAKAIKARAYTMGNHIVFQTGEFSSSQNEGKALIAHELAHVVQQEANASTEFGSTSRSGDVLRRQPAGEPDEPLDVALARQDLIDKIAEINHKLHEQFDAAKVDSAERMTRQAPFFVQEDQEVQRAERQIASGRTQVPEKIAKLQKSLTLAAKAVLRESDDLDELRSKIALVEWLNNFTPTLLRDTAKYEELLKEKKSGETELAETLVFFQGVKRQIEITKRFLPERAEYLAQRSRYLETQATSAARRAGVRPDSPTSPGQLALIRTIIEASPTLRPYLTVQRASGHQPTDLRDARKIIIHSSESDFQDEVQRLVNDTPERGTKVGGFYDRPTDTIHLPPDTQFGVVLHEAVHKYSQRVLQGVCGQFLNEGLTQYFADIVLTDQGLPEFKGHAYEKQLACAKRFVHTYRREEVASAYFLGVAGLGTGRLNQFARSRQCNSFCAPEQQPSSD
jgi:hypothetical protein